MSSEIIFVFSLFILTLFAFVIFVERKNGKRFFEEQRIFLDRMTVRAFARLRAFFHDYDKLSAVKRGLAFLHLVCMRTLRKFAKKLERLTRSQIRKIECKDASEHLRNIRSDKDSNVQ